MTAALTPQAALVLDYLTSEPGRRLTPLIAHTTLGVASLTARIAELRKQTNLDGTPVYIIKDVWATDHFNRRYKAYWYEASGGAAT